mgnify:CR=1 FL=1
MSKTIIDFVKIEAGWMNMQIYDNMAMSIREMRISYLQNFFDDLLGACKFLLGKNIGVYELEIDQEGFDALMRFHKYGSKVFSLEIIEDFFEDEVPYNGTYEDWERFHSQEVIPTRLIYSDVEIKKFVNIILTIIYKRRDEYNEGFVLSPSDELDIQLLKEVAKMNKG